MQRRLAAAAAIACALGLASATSASGRAPQSLVESRSENPLADLHLAQAPETQSGQSEREPSDADSAAEPPRQPSSGGTGRPPSGDRDSFGGSAEPAGPDLTVEQERELISRGWD